MQRLIKIGTRSSELALIQTQKVINAITSISDEFKFEIVKIKTKGDLLSNLNIKDIGGKGVFVKEIEKALLNKEIDIAVHSMKDMPYETPDTLKIFPVLKRDDPRDVFISKAHNKFLDLNKGSKIGTSSLRRQDQLIKLRNDIEFVPIRGNIGTRINKMYDMDLDGIVLAAAGLNRLEIQDIATEYFSVEDIVPSPCQGILCVEIREDFQDIFYRFYESIIDKKTNYQALIERKLLKIFGADCKTSFGAYADLKQTNIGEQLEIRVFYKKDQKVFKSFIIGSVEESDKMINILFKNFGG